MKSSFQNTATVDSSRSDLHRSARITLFASEFTGYDVANHSEALGFRPLLLRLRDANIYLPRFDLLLPPPDWRAGYIAVSRYRSVSRPFVRDERLDLRRVHFDNVSSALYEFRQFIMKSFAFKTTCRTGDTDRSVYFARRVLDRGGDTS